MTRLSRLARSNGHARVAALVLVLGAAEARADESDVKKACLDASSQSQTLRDAHKFLEARATLRACAQASCPSVVRRDCTTWLDEVEAALPTVVLSLKDEDAHDLFDASVTMDGQPFADKLTGTAAPVDPGPHRFRFVRVDGSAIETEVLVAEGVKSLPVAAHFPLRAPAAPVEPVPVTSPLRTLGWAVGGVGAVGLIVGGVFGGLAVSDKSNANCNSANRCMNFASVSSAKTAANVADVGLIAGGVLLATGAGLVVFAPHSSKSSTAWAVAAPTVGSNTCGFVVVGGF